MTTDAERFLMIGAALFILGAIGFLTRRNMILMVLSTELMLHGVSLTLVTFGRLHQTQEGQAFTIFVLTVAACEAGLALALVLSLYRNMRSLDVLLWSSLGEPDTSARVVENIPDEEAAVPYEKGPALTPAGVVPKNPGRPSSYSSTGTSKT